MKLFLFLLLVFSSFIINAQISNHIIYTDEVEVKDGLVYYDGVLFSKILRDDAKEVPNACKCTLTAKYLNGKLNGTKKEWHQNGKLKFSGKYLLGKAEGEHVYYNLNGGVVEIRKYSHGVLLLQPLTYQKELIYLFSIYKPDEYPDKFLKEYLEGFDKKHFEYRNNEFELKRKVDNLKKNLNSEVKNVNFNVTYSNSGYTYLPEYSFETKSYKLRLKFKQPYKRSGSSLFYNSSMTSKGEKYALNAPTIEFINSNNFSSIYLPPSKAEELKNKLIDNELFYTFEYKILSSSGIGNEREIKYISAYIKSITFYSDKKLTKQVYYYIDKSKKNDIADLKNNIISTIKIRKHPSPHGGMKMNNNSFFHTGEHREPVWDGYLIDLFRENGVTADAFFDCGIVYAGSGKFKDKSSGKLYTQRQLYEYLNFKNIKAKVNSVPEKIQPIKPITHSNIQNISVAEKASKTEIEEWINEGERYYKNNNSRKAFEMYRRAAINGNAEAQNIVGVMYEKAKGVKQSYEKAFYWYNKSALQNNAKGQMNLSFLYFLGEGIEKNIKKAEELLTKSANQGYSEAQHVLATLYSTSNGFRKDMSKVLYWQEKAANQEHPRAQFALGTMYKQGKGVKKNRKTAKMWYKKSCNQNYADACKSLEQMQAFGNSLLKIGNEVLKETSRNNYRK